MGIETWLAVGVSVAALMTFGINVFIRPNAKQDAGIIKLQAKAEARDERISALEQTALKNQVAIERMATNDLPHINMELTEIKTILNERLPKK